MNCWPVGRRDGRRTKRSARCATCSAGGGAACRPALRPGSLRGARGARRRADACACGAAAGGRKHDLTACTGVGCRTARADAAGVRRGGSRPSDDVPASAFARSGSDPVGHCGRSRRRGAVSGIRTAPAPLLLYRRGGGLRPRAGDGRHALPRRFVGARRAGPHGGPLDRMYR